MRRQSRAHIHDRGAISTLLKAVKAMEKQVRRCLTRANDVLITNGNAIKDAGCTKYESCPNFTIKFFQYSGIGNGIEFACFPSEARCQLLTESAIYSTLSSVVGNSDACAEDIQHGLVCDDQDIVGGVESYEHGGERVDSHDGGSDTMESSGDHENALAGDSLCSVDIIEQDIAIGVITGVHIATQSQLRRRVQRWSKPTILEPVNPSELLARDMVSHAVRTALKLQHTGEFQLHNGRHFMFPPDTMTHGCEVGITFKRGWAVRPPKDQMYGARYIAVFRDRIEELYDIGAANASEKLGPGRILEILEAENPRRFDLPEENEIRQEISKLKIKSRTRPPALSSAAPGTISNQKRARCPAIVDQIVNQLLNDNPECTAIRAMCPETTLTDKQLSNKINNTKTQRKKLRAVG